MRRDIPPLYVLMARCLIKYMGNFSFRNRKPTAGWG